MHSISPRRTTGTFLLCLLLLLVFLPASGLAASAAPSSASARYDKALADFTALEKNSKRAAFRENWQAVIKSFDPLAGGSGELSSKARFQQARAWEELAKRSVSDADFREAAAAYGRMAAKGPKNSLADDALFRQASILAEKLDKPAEARRVADTLLSRYPKSKHAAAAAKLKAEAEKEAAKPATPKPRAAAKTVADPAAATSLYKAAADEWRALLADSKRNTLRDGWLNLEKRFLAALDKDPEGTNAPKALFQAARCMEELASRSWLRSDWQAAVTHFLAMNERFPSSNLADDALFRAAFIQARRLDDTEGARKNANAVLTRHPKSDMAKSARDLLQSLPAAPSLPPPAVKETPPSSKEAVSVRALRSVSTARKGKGASVTLELSAATRFESQYLASPGKGVPDRLQLDLADTKPDKSVKPGLTLQGGPITRIRTAQPGTGATRVLFDLSGVRQYKVSAEKNPPRIVVQCSQAEDIPGGVKPDRSAGTVQHGTSPKADEKPGSLVEQLGLTVRTIMLDAGHGGKDPGAMGNGIRESTVTLQIAKLLGQHLQKRGFTVLYTRTTDRFIALEQRTAMANDKKADLFVSLHINANTDPNIQGMETYFLDLARSSSAAHVAARENAVSVRSISDLQFILTDLMLSSKLQESREMAQFAHDRIAGRLQRAGFTCRDNGVRSAPFYVLMGARMPAVLLELGYLSNKEDAARLKSPIFHERLAEGIADGIAAYKQKLDRFASR